MVSLPPTWEATPASPPAIVQSEADDRSQSAPAATPTPLPDPQTESARLEAARSRVQQHLQQIVEANRSMQQGQQAVPSSAGTATPQPIPTPTLPSADPSSQAEQRKTTESVPSLQKPQNPKKPETTSPPTAPAATAPVVPESAATLSLSPADSIPFIPDSIGVPATTLGNFCSTAPESHSKPSFLSSIAQLSVGIADFLNIPRPPDRKPQGQAIDLRTLKGSPSPNCNGLGKLGFPLASPAPMTSGFGWRIHPVLGTGRMHTGIDFGAAHGTIVRASQSGTIVTAGDAGDGYGGKVVIQSADNTERTLYAHLSSVAVRLGDRVVQGQAIGRVGSTGLSTGPHLHFEVQVPTAAGGWQAVNPLGTGSAMSR